MSDYLKSSLAVGLLRVLGILPLSWVYGLSKLTLLLMLRFSTQSLKQTRLNVQRCWPNLTQQQQTTLVDESMLHTIYAALEMGINWTQPSQSGLDRIIKVSGADCLKQAHLMGGVILLTPHLGNWELFANWAAHEAKVTALYKPAKLHGLDRLIHGARTKAGMQLAPASAKGVMQLKRALLKGEVNLILPDQEPPPKAGIISQWFNQPAYTMTLVSQLAKTKNTRILMGFARRVPSRLGFIIELEDITEVCQQTTIETSVKAINQAIEELVRRAPEQYQWEYRRFKHTLEQEH